jgi:hypothetical protein
MTDYTKYNRTELATLCRRKRIFVAHPELQKDSLIDLLEGRLSKEDFVEDPVDLERVAMVEIMEEWPCVEYQLTCDKVCEHCPSARVIACSKVNCDPKIHKELQLRRS